MKYRKKPVEIEAHRFTGTTTSRVALEQWMRGEDYVEPVVHTRDRVKMAVRTLEGTMWADEGDYIIKGVRGEFYPCKPHIFEETYEAV